MSPASIFRAETKKRRNVPMKKRLICLLMSILMLLSCMLVGCSSNDEDDVPDLGDGVDNSANICWA